MSTFRLRSSARMRRPLSSVPVTPTYFARKPRLAQAHIAVAICPPQRMWRSRIRIFADGPVGCGYPGRMLTESTEFSPMPITSQRASEAVIVAEYTAPADASPLRARDETVRRAPRRRRHHARRRIGRVPRPPRTLRLRQDDAAPAARRARAARLGRDLDR